MKLLRNKWFIIALLVVAVGLFAAFALSRKEKPQYFTSKVERGDVRDVVEATGTINAVITVQVGSQVSGTIQTLFADFNSRVKKGQVIARIDPSLFEGALLQAKADLENARANLASAKANLEKARATAVQAKADYERTAGLAKEGVMSQQQLDLAKATYDSADAQVSASAAQVTQAAAQVQQKSAAVNVAQTNLNYTTIHSPIDGTVVARNVDVGQTVAASLQAPTLFTIAQDLTKMQVYVSTDESDVGNIRAGQNATFKVDAFPRDTFHGHVSQIRLNATTVQNVVTYTTVVDFDNPDLKLFPGMTAYVTLPVATASNVLKVANGALRYKPDLKPEEVRALYQRYGIDAPGGSGGGNQARSGGGPQARAGGGASRPPGQQSGNPAERPTREPRQDVNIVWKLLPDGSLQPVKLKTGITDHTYTELTQVLQGDALKDGDELVTGTKTVRATSSPIGGPQRR
ncbi:MAG TPA: efflux RND transporter periplasmic adaptor subunit [Terriglobales bacterium]|nr:efflux RND transporter periplasmic adaptor subunit [Terriglobales bacterium]